MGEVSTFGDNVRYRIRDKGSRQATDANLLASLNSILRELWQTLQNIQSNYVYKEGTISLVDGTREYTPSFSHDGFVDDGVWIDEYSGDFLPLIMESDVVAIEGDDETEGTPKYYYMTEDGDVGFVPTPNASMTALVTYNAQLSTLTDFDNDDFPAWASHFRQYLEDRVVGELLDRLERNSAPAFAKASVNYNRGMSQIYNRGVRGRKVQSGFFSARGV